MTQHTRKAFAEVYGSLLRAGWDRPSGLDAPEGNEPEPAEARLVKVTVGETAESTEPTEVIKQSASDEPEEIRVVLKKIVRFVRDLAEQAERLRAERH